MTQSGSGFSYTTRFFCLSNAWPKPSWLSHLYSENVGLYCCDRAEDHACQNACKRILMSKKTEMEIVDGLIEGCKTQPLPQDPLWQCFLESSQSVHPGVTLHPPPSTGLDGAKLHCCSKANTSTCRSVPHSPLLKPVENSVLINDFKCGKCVLYPCTV